MVSCCFGGDHAQCHDGSAFHKLYIFHILSRCLLIGQKCAEIMCSTARLHYFTPGNSAIDACEVTPANVPEVITVGGSNLANKFSPSAFSRAGRAEDIYKWSNTGQCVDIFAPGVDIFGACGGKGVQPLCMESNVFEFGKNIRNITDGTCSIQPDCLRRRLACCWHSGARAACQRAGSS